MKAAYALIAVFFLWDAKASDLSERIAELPENSPSERVKKAALEVSLERLKEIQAAAEPEADNLEKEIRTRLTESADEVAARREGPNLSVLRPPLVSNGNPHLERLVAGASEELSKPDVVWPRIGTGRPLFDSATAPGPYNPRQAAAAMEAWFWLYANPSSPMKGEPEALRRVIRRTLAYADAIVSSGEEGRKESIYDDFAMAPASIVLRELVTLHPMLLLPTERLLVRNAMRTAGSVVLKHSLAHADRNSRGYANIDAALALQLLNFGLFLSDEPMLAQSRGFLSRIDRAVLPDGGTHYIWSQNESYGYHGVIAQFLAQMHEISGEEQPLKTLQRLEWYGPVSVGPVAEYWTAPSWKHTWNNEMKSFPAGDYVAGVTGNPYVRKLVGEPDPSRLRGWEAARLPLPWYRNDIPPADLPDNVLFVDRNIDGPRGRFGRFHFAATLREIPIDEPGHATLMGAMTVTDQLGLQAILMGVGPRVFVGADRKDPRSWAYLTSGMKCSRAASRNAFAFAATHGLAAFRSSTKGPVVPATGSQVWFVSGERLIGLIRIAADDDTDPSLLEGVVRLGTGGTVAGPMQALRSLETQGWTFGDLTVQTHGHNFGETTDEIIPFRRADAPITEVQWRGAPSHETAWFAVEIRPSSTNPAVVTLTGPASAQPRIGIRVDDKAYEVAANFGSEPISMDGAYGNEKTVSRWMGGRAQSGPFRLEPGGVLLTVISPIAEDHQPGWESLQQAIETSETGL